MRKAATKKRVTTTSGVVESEAKRLAAAMLARQQFLAATLNLTWRLAVTVIIPIIIGVKLDEHFSSSPFLTLTGLVLAALAGSVAVWSTVKEVNRQQAESAPRAHKKTKQRLNHA